MLQVAHVKTICNADLARLTGFGIKIGPARPAGFQCGGQMRHYQRGLLFAGLWAVCMEAFYHCGDAGIDRAVVDKILQTQGMTAIVACCEIEVQLLFWCPLVFKHRLLQIVADVVICTGQPSARHQFDTSA